MITFTLALMIGAAATTPRDSLSLDDCLRLAHENNPRGNISSHAVNAANLSLQELHLQGYPQVKFKGSALYAPVGKHFGYDPALTNGGQVGSQLVVEQTLYDGGQRGLKLKQLELDVTRTERERKMSESELRFDVEQAFTDVLRLEEEVDLKRRSQAQLRDYLNLVQRMHTGGQAGYTDVLKTRIQVSEAESDWKQSVADERAAKYTLSELLGIPLDDNLNLKGALDSAEEPTVLDTSRNAEFEIARLDIQSAELDAALSRAEWKPSISVSADAGLLTSWENLEASAKNRANMLGTSVGLNIDFPIFAWGLRDLHERQKRLNLETSKWQFEARRRGILADFRKSELQWSSARERRDAVRANVSAARDNFLLTQSKYAGGSGLASEVLEAHKLWVDTQMSLLNAEADLRLLSAKMRRLDVH